MSNNIVVLIPSRLKSTRLPNKPLVDVNGKTLVHRVYEEAAKAGFPTYCCIDDESVAKEIDSFGGKYIMTDPELPSGSDRAYQALEKIDPEGKFDVIVNFQGDSLNVDHNVLSDLAKLLIEKDCDLTTVAIPMKPESYGDPTLVKIAMDYNPQERAGNCLYFSRSLIPFYRDGGEQHIYHHIGIYVYKRAALKQFVQSEPSVLERIEMLEQLRALSMGMRIHAKFYEDIRIVKDAPVDINTPEEWELCKKYFK